MFCKVCFPEIHIPDTSIIWLLQLYIVEIIELEYFIATTDPKWVFSFLLMSLDISYLIGLEWIIKNLD